MFVVKRFTDDTTEQDKLEIKVTAIQCWGEVCRGCHGYTEKGNFISSGGWGPFLEAQCRGVTS